MTVVYRRDVVPGSERVQRLAVHQGFALGSRLGIAVEIPLIIDDPDFKEHPVVCVGAGLRILLTEMKPPLLPLSAVGTEDGFPGEGLGAGQWVVVNEQRIIHTVELNSLAEGRIDDFGLSKNCSFIAAN